MYPEARARSAQSLSGSRPGWRCVWLRGVLRSVSR